MTAQSLGALISADPTLRQLADRALRELDVTTLSDAALTALILHLEAEIARREQELRDRRLLTERIDAGGAS